MKRTQLGVWLLESRQDPRFNLRGHGEVHPDQLPTEARALLHLKVAELGVSPPEDLEYEYRRDLFQDEATSSTVWN